MALKSAESFETSDSTGANLSDIPSLCVLLKQTREKQGLSIEQVCHTLKIRKFFIEAIESGNFGELPGIVYTTGFIQSYCKLLKIDPAFAKHALRKIDSPCDQLTVTSFNEPSSVTTFSPWAIGSSLVISLILIMGFLAFRSDFLKDKIKPTPIEPTSFISKLSEFNPNVLKESLITFYALDQTWIQLTDDKEKVIETRLLSSGEVYQTVYQPGIHLTTGNSQALKVYNGHQSLTLPVSSPQSSVPFLAAENPDLLENYPLT